MSPVFGEVSVIGGVSCAAINNRISEIRKRSFIGRTYKFNMKGNGGQQKRLMASLNGEAIPVRAPGASVSTLLRDALRLVAHLPWRTVRFAMNCSSHSKIGRAREKRSSQHLHRP
jgi:hypothetical protein